MVEKGSGSGAKLTSTGRQAGFPLEGLTFLNTREAGAAAELTGRLTALGARVIECPAIAFVPPADWRPFDDALRRLRAGDWVVFSSATAVRFSAERMEDLGLSMDALGKAKVAAVGPGTAAALRAQGIAADLVPEHFQAEGLLEAMLARLPPDARVWLPRAETGREVLAEGLGEAGFQVEATPAYRTVAPPEGLGEALEILKAGGLDWLLFTSPSTVTHFLQMLPPEVRVALESRWPAIACLGRVTAERARDEGLPVSAVPARQELEGLVEAVVDAVAGRGVENGRKSGK